MLRTSDSLMPENTLTAFTYEQLSLIKLLTLQALKPYATVSNPDKGIMYNNLLKLKEKVEVAQTL